ncbi:unnamed protein product [Brugia pahangi]|uniref:DUF1738 domain-containing protein n=1 Tax=Brugia pahangi TaxID=6280 RepID=A0A0N4T8J5_BRUPA|nr:unnamed protein product [Brugia pahangi]
MSFPDVIFMKLASSLWYPIVRNWKGVAIWKESDRIKFPKGKSERRFAFHKVNLLIIVTVKIKV